MLPRLRHAVFVYPLISFMLSFFIELVAVQLPGTLDDTAASYAKATGCGFRPLVLLCLTLWIHYLLHLDVSSGRIAGKKDEFNGIDWL